jgi:RimJ/RimL family protein N-acetyltransferase
MFAYVFGQMECVRMTTTQHEFNDYAHNIVEKIGFVQECILKNYYGKGVNAIQYYILPEMVDKKWDLKL